MFACLNLWTVYTIGKLVERHIGSDENQLHICVLSLVMPIWSFGGLSDPQTTQPPRFSLFGAGGHTPISRRHKGRRGKGTLYKRQRGFVTPQTLVLYSSPLLYPREFFIYPPFSPFLHTILPKTDVFGGYKVVPSSNSRGYVFPSLLAP